MRTAESGALQCIIKGSGAYYGRVMVMTLLDNRSYSNNKLGEYEMHFAVFQGRIKRTYS